MDGKFNSTTWEKLENKKYIWKIWYPWIITSTKRIGQQDFQTTWMKISLVLNPDHGIRKLKVKAKIWCVHNVNAKGLYYKNVTKIE